MAGGVGDRLVRVGVGLQEDAVGSGGEGGAREGGDVFALTAADPARRAGELDAMGGINDGGMSVCRHDTETAHIDDEVLVAEGGAAIGLPNFVGPGFLQFFDYKLHFLWGEELTLFDVDGAVGFCGGEEEVGLPAKKGGDLEGVDHCADRLALFGQMDIGDRFKSVLGFDGLEYFEPAIEAGATVTANGGAVCFVEGTFEKDIQLRVLFLQRLEGIGDRSTGFEALEGTGAREEEELIRVVQHSDI